MARGLRLSAWARFGVALAVAALLAWFAPRDALDWQPALFAREPWRALSAAFVHWSPLHLAANLLGCAVLAFVGRAARLPTRAAWAWAAAWPLTQIALLARPDLERFAGLSGVLHAGVAVLVVELLLARRHRQRAIGAAVALGLAIKLLLEDPLGAPLRQVPGWDIAIAPLSHLTGALAGALCALVALAVARAHANAWA